MALHHPRQPAAGDRQTGQRHLRGRDPNWWGSGTACASDSKKFGSWESNLMTEWHQRYGTGVGAGFPEIITAA